jgi:hypothetical protein
MHRLAALTFALVIIPMSSALAEGKDPLALRVTVFNQGTNVYVMGIGMEILSPITTLPLGVPVVEAMVPLGPGELLIGTGFHRMSISREDKHDDYKIEGSLTGWLLNVGYAYKLARAENTCLKFGGRAGLAILGKEEMEYGYDNDGGDSDSDEIDSSFQLSAFVGADYFPARHFGLAIEAGLSFVTLAFSEWDQSWLTLYGAFSGILRF